jgi:hypothetical protein
VATECEECKIKERLLAEAHQKIGRLTDDCRDLYEELKIVRRREERVVQALTENARLTEVLVKRTEA